MIIAQNTLLKNIETHLHLKEKESQLVRIKKLEEQGPRLYPSSIWKCSRCVWYEMMGFPREILKPQMVRVCKNGDSMHERYQRWFEEMGILVENEYPIKFPEYRISGRIDSIITLPSVNDLAVVELKSAKDKYFKQMIKEGKPLQKYVDQVYLYLALLQMPYAIIMVENKNDQEVLEFMLEYEEPEGRRIMDKVVYINECVTEKKLPRRDYHQGSYECKWCDFKGFCENNATSCMMPSTEDGFHLLEQTQ